MEKKYKIGLSLLLIIGLIGITTAQLSSYDRGSVNVDRDGNYIVDVDGDIETFTEEQMKDKIYQEKVRELDDQVKSARAIKYKQIKLYIEISQQQNNLNDDELDTIITLLKNANDENINDLVQRRLN